MIFVTAAVYADGIDATVTDMTPTAPLTNPTAGLFQPRYISGIGSDGSFTVFFEDRDAGQLISHASTVTGPTGLPPMITPSNIADTHFCIKDWPINIGGTDYAYRAWASVGNNMDHKFYVSNDMTNWVLVSTFTIPNDVGFVGPRGWVYYGFHDVIELNGTYYAFAESNQSQTMICRSANGDDVWEAFASIGGNLAGDGPLQDPIPGGWTPTGNFFDLGADRGMGKLYVQGDDSAMYLAINTAARTTLAPPDLEAAFINPANWTWHDGNAGVPVAPLLTENAEHDIRECWLVPSTTGATVWDIIYDADFGAGDGGKALGYAVLSAPLLTEVWVDDDYCDVCANDGHTWGYDAFDNIKDGIAAVEGSTVNVAPGTYVEDGQIVIDKDVTIVGDSGDRPVVKTNADTGSSGDSRGWWLVQDGSTLNLQNLILNGEGHLVYQGIRHMGQGSIQNVDFVNIKYNESGPNYSGLAIAAFGDDGPVNLSNCNFSEIGRVGILYFGSGVNGSVYDGCTYVGKDDGDWLDYGVEAGAGAQITVANSTISDCLGVASSDGSTSAGILVTTYYGPGSEAVITGCTITNCTTGIAVGYDDDDTSVVTANYNNIFGNDMGIDNLSSVEVDAENNWWGDPSGPNHSPGEGDPVSDNVDYDPWLTQPYGDNVLWLNVQPDSLYVQPGDPVVTDMDIHNLLQKVVGCQAVMAYSSTYLQASAGCIVPGGAPWDELIYNSWDVGAGAPGEIDTAIGIDATLEQPSTGTDADNTIAIITLTALVEGTTEILFRPDVDDIESTYLADMNAQAVWPEKFASQTIVIDGTNPVVEVISPNGGEDLKGGGSWMITWTAGDEHLDESSVMLEYYDGGGWVEIASNEDNDGAYMWTPIPLLDIATAKVRVTVWDKAGNSADDESDAAFTIDSTDPTVDDIAASQDAGPDITPSGAGNAVQGVVDIAVATSDNLSGVAGPPTVTVEDSIAAPMPVTYVNEDPAGTFNYTVTVTATTANGTATITVSALADNAGNVAANVTDTFDINKNQVTGQVQLEGLAPPPGGLTRTVVFVATGGVKTTWDVPLDFAEGADTASFTLADVPNGTTHLSAKTAWNLRRKVGASLDGDGQATADLTGSNQVLGGDLNGSNTTSILDFAILRINWFTHEAVADINGDGDVKFSDFLLLRNNWFMRGDDE